MILFFGLSGSREPKPPRADSGIDAKSENVVHTLFVSQSFNLYF